MSTTTEPQEDPGAALGHQITFTAGGDLTGTAEIEEIARVVATLPAGTAVVVDLSAVTHLSMEAAVPLVQLVSGCAAADRPVRVRASEPVRLKLARLGLVSTIPLESGAGESP
ncbi:hypothetical protein [Amycolatopsis sp. CA-128772]|uniref:hypothetical protein n=1 Tax=Amycolatopsis sp. CA-128772 TaxID=2073159 RepID=UPI000CD1F179|nr:hypothetical protein [Amycolatopsis sp. CA-128772]